MVSLWIAWSGLKLLCLAMITSWPELDRWRPSEVIKNLMHSRLFRYTFTSHDNEGWWLREGEVGTMKMRGSQEILIWMFSISCSLCDDNLQLSPRLYSMWLHHSPQLSSSIFQRQLSFRVWELGTLILVCISHGDGYRLHFSTRCISQTDQSNIFVKPWGRAQLSLQFFMSFVWYKYDYLFSPEW